MDLPEPTKLLISAIKHSPNHLPSILRLSEIYIQKKEFHKAIRLLTDSQHNGASNSKLFYLLSKVFFLQEQWLDARINIEKSLSQDSTSVTSLELAISIYSKLEDHDQCVKYLELLLEEKPQAKDYFRLSKLLKGEDHYARSVSYLEEAAHLDPKNEIFITTLLNAYKDCLKYPFLRLNYDDLRQKGKRIIDQLILMDLNEASLTESFSFLLEANLNEELIDLYEDLKPHKKKLFNGEILFFLAQAYFNVERFEKSISTLMQIQKGNDEELYELYLLRCYSLTSTKYEINKKKLNQLKKSYFDKKQSHIDCFLLKNDFLSAKKVLHDLKSFESILHDFFER